MSPEVLVVTSSLLPVSVFSFVSSGFLHSSPALSVSSLDMKKLVQEVKEVG
ncbi:hypothetical protein D3C72_2412320 [compost metagenome]